MSNNSFIVNSLTKNQITHLQRTKSLTKNQITHLLKVQISSAPDQYLVLYYFQFTLLSNLTVDQKLGRCLERI